MAANTRAACAKEYGTLTDLCRGARGRFKEFEGIRKSKRRRAIAVQNQRVKLNKC